jgi:hypothetical protein
MHIVFLFLNISVKIIIWLQYYNSHIQIFMAKLHTFEAPRPARANPNPHSFPSTKLTLTLIFIIFWNRDVVQHRLIEKKK